MGFLDALKNSLNQGVRKIISDTKDDISKIDKKTQRVTIRFFNKNKKLFYDYVSRISYLSKMNLKSENQALNNYEIKMVNVFRKFLSSMKRQLDVFDKTIVSNNPEHILNLGYSITLSDGKVITNADELKEGKMVETRLKNGKIISEVRKMTK